MPSKRKRGIEDFDPNKSDSDDENFEPGANAPAVRNKKRSRGPKIQRSAGGRRRSNRYNGSDIEDDDDNVSGSQDEGSFVSEEEEEVNAPVNAAGRRARKAATKHNSYKESDDEEPEDAEESDDVLSEDLPKPKKKESLLIKLKVPKTASTPAPAAHVTRRSTRARTEEVGEEHVELTNSGKHSRPASRSRSPEAFARTRSSRSIKGLKKGPETIEEATQESSGPRVDDADVDELAGDVEEAVAEIKDAEMEDVKESTEQAPAVDVVVDEDDDEDVGPITRRTRAKRGSGSVAGTAEPDADGKREAEDDGPKRRLTRRNGLRKSKSVQEPSSDFEPGEESAEEEAHMSESPKKDSGDGDGDDGDFDSPAPRGRAAAKLKGRSTRSSRRGVESAEEVELDQDELAEELHELRQDSRSRRTRRPSPAIIYQETASKRRRAAAKPMNYFMPPLSAVNLEEDAEDPAPTPARRRGGRGGATQSWDRALNTTFGPFGGGGGAGSLLTGPWGAGAAGGVDSDSSDDEMGQRSGAAGNVGMTPTSGAAPAGLLPGPAQPLGGDAGVGATPNVGKIKNQKALADADPLGVDLTVDFNHVGGLQGHIDQLKEMVQLPLLYPELFQKFHVTPPRGVLFHGPPGTGKTLLARALANSVGIGGRKITFYMRKGADALSKWVGEAEKQLRLLFEEARRTQPSIIFFDEIDGLAPVRSSKQEQIHASIVSTLLALMDGMDGRGQVIVIGATNRPDNIDPALRRPGRFDREFYFPLPDVAGRKSILEIHTKDWGLSEPFKQQLAENTKGYGGADLRALCTEAALNAIQRTYPQVYSSKDKLIVNPDNISIHATDFMLSIKKMIPSSERSAGTGAAPLPKGVEPLLRDQFQSIKKALDEVLPRKKKLTALEEAMYEQFDDEDQGFGREALHQEFERSRIFRPRFLIHGFSGMGQSYLSSALLHYFEGVQVQNFGLPNLLGDGRPMEQVIVSLFTEVKRHKPSVIYIPSIDSWYAAMKDTLPFITFKAMLKSIPPTDPILLLATAEYEAGEGLAPDLVRELFSFSRKNRLQIERPMHVNRQEYFAAIVEHIRKSPADFPDPANRKKRVLEQLPVAPPPPPKVPSKEEVKAMQKRDHQLLNILKVQLQPIMDQINRKYKKFRQPVITPAQLEYLFLEMDPNYVRPDIIVAEDRPFEIVKDKYGDDVLRETATGKTFYNLETTTIEERLSNGFYCRPKDFLRDIKSLAKDSKSIGDKERTLKANELVSNVEVDVATIEGNTSTVDWEALHQRQLQRAKAAAEKERKRKALQSVVDRIQSDVAGGNDSDSQGPITLGERIPGSAHAMARFQVMSPAPGDNAETQQPSNGGPEPSRLSDVQMSGVDDDTTQDSSMQPPSQWPQQANPTTGATTGTTQVSQRSIITTVPPGMSPSAIINDASTTKTSDPSERSTDKWSTQATNGFHPDQSSQGDTSQLQDTQVPAGMGGVSQATSSDDPWPHSQAHGMARGVIRPPGSQTSSPNKSRSSGDPKHAMPLVNILNESASDDIRNSGSSSSQQQPVIHEGQVTQFLDELTERTSGCTIEQLEQINRELMDEIWNTRHEWNRMKVLSDLTNVFNETISDIESIQGLFQQSQGS
ncbi:Tat-binding -like protein 7 [Colletotrichum tanaceti]|uniref:Tat-binding-like protein 7 n=1 Tax=Colletotrichum tanaceti TaxID=1306861 RepID=A0A4U6X1D1_9PEZI|nr:Tat-binding -like protein 7 [Colletotrichum tanaceti]TKW49182.1 Tat-binding -like protein 7 [Colletotrichum tanaceti]